VQIEDVKKVLQSLDIPVQNLAELMTDGAPNVTARNNGVSLINANDMTNATDRDMIFDNTI
jgi:hypothetical protein